MKKILLILMLLLVISLTIGTIEAVKIKAKCFGGDKKHKTIWTKKLDTEENRRIVLKDDKEYVESLKYYNWYTKCNHKSHKEDLYSNRLRGVYGECVPDWSNGKIVYTYKLAKWKKIGSGTYTDKFCEEEGFKKKRAYSLYIEGSKNAKITFYKFRTKDNKKIKEDSIYFTKENKFYSSDIVIHYNYDIAMSASSESNEKDYYIFNGTLKNYIKLYMKDFKNRIKENEKFQSSLT